MASAFSERVQLLVSEEMRDAIEFSADQLEVTVSQWVRDACRDRLRKLSAPVPVVPGSTRSRVVPGYGTDFHHGAEYHQ
jgi:hypothetical protein